ncbi:hypothetical protein A3A95_04340 [Candidatus Nomurabacteria bacterium RIFCSPLOWO2_01_FULL_39_18]|uniref:DedA family protein n=1 Tax=Candidatus Nomurabacteria bacterium RIFCSPHIGHO2_01_FULL_40_24b TaxID=1801739 RepID=A0A1F6V6B3_9BACT|nr:MAG: hypothetical protein A2647_04185 [Candidatus Nomurabacteria bacterium RIFCSPHIGHO2_01_FULL_40_24b]OGI89325.1 MAG: hypothetical protein A3A95_04340 [Candidatus Nomurabacteria bacterium RIFCSPLOWO2_01_FULL_39_18]
MIEWIEWLRVFIINHRSLEYIIILGGVIFGGEFALFALGFLVAQGVLPAFSVVVLSFLGSFPPNILWFLLGKTATVERIIKHRYASTISIIGEAVTRASRGNHFIGLIFAKFIVGTPVVLTTYVQKTDLSFWQFIFYETPAIALSLLILISIGYLSGLGFTYLADIFNNIYVAIGFILLIMAIILAAQSWLKKRFTDVKN